METNYKVVGELPGCLRVYVFCAFEEVNCRGTLPLFFNLWSTHGTIRTCTLIVFGEWSEVLE